MYRTAKEIRDKHTNANRKGSIPQVEVVLLYELAEKEAAVLGRKEVISVDDILSLERNGRVIVSDMFFHLCDEQARTALLHDEHHFVHACASISERAIT